MTCSLCGKPLTGDRINVVKKWDDRTGKGEFDFCTPCWDDLVYPEITEVVRRYNPASVVREVSGGTREMP